MQHIHTSWLRNRVYKLPCGKRILLFRRGNFSGRRVLPFVERGPFGCWQASWRWGQLGRELRRWL